MHNEASDLISMSATRSTNQIKLFPMAYGTAGYDGLGNPPSPMSVKSTTYSSDFSINSMLRAIAASSSTRSILIAYTLPTNSDFNVNYVYYAPKRLTNCSGFVFASVQENVISCGNQKVLRIV